MWTRDKDYFEQLSKQCGSPYAAVNFIAKSARNKLLEVNNQILDSEAISWVLTGIAPEIKKRHKVYYLNGNHISYLDDVLSCVDDVEVCQSVRDSYFISCKANHLIYSYNPELDNDRQARVRVLTRMIWFKEL